jgi:hypothetical protein
VSDVQPRPLPSLKEDSMRSMESMKSIETMKSMKLPELLDKTRSSAAYGKDKDYGKEY